MASPPMLGLVELIMSLKATFVSSPHTTSICGKGTVSSCSGGHGMDNVLLPFIPALGENTVNVGARFEDSNITIDHDSEFFVEWICEFIHEDEESHEVLFHVDNVTVGHPNSDHVFLVTSNRDLFDVQGGGGDDDDNGEGSSSIEKFSFSSCKEAYFRFSLLDTDLCPLPNCEVTKCGVHLLYSEDVESTKSTHDGIDSSDDQVELLLGVEEMAAKMLRIPTLNQKLSI
ncbi:hypothetical protein LWI28_009319 [Acer negundo]|uniref:Uncharacterized protein n=1 Tax=Acer negundo TaxID=4023 RepID=A0AAD5NLI3_ACENE|nr:hypothetical protein LWI28_009319 [Acer negundo]